MFQNNIETNYGYFLERFFGVRTLDHDTPMVDSLLDQLNVYFWMHDEEYSIVYANRAVQELCGPYMGRKCYDYFMGEKNTCSCCLSRPILAGEQDEMCTHCRRSNKTFDINIFHIPIVAENGRKLIVKSNMHIQDIRTLGRNH